MKNQLFRAIQPQEQRVISSLLVEPFPGRDEIFEQMATAMAKTIDENGSLEFLINSLTKLNHVKYVVPVEGEYEDRDGGTVHVLLHVSGDKIHELEFFREDGARVLSWPVTALLRVFVPQ